MKKHVLVVDDDPDILKVLKSLLHEHFSNEQLPQI